MTYPPQQPPGPYGPQDPWGQPPQGPFPPQQGPFPPQQQPPSAAPPWLAEGGGGFPSFEPDPKKPRTGLIATLVIVGLLVLGGGGFGLWMLLSKDDSGGGGGDGGGGGGGGGDGSDARTVAEKYVEELETTVNTEIADIDLSSMEPLTCSDDFGQMEQEIGAAQESGDEGTAAPGTIEVGMKDFQSTEDEGSFVLTQKVDGEAGPDQEMSMSKEDGAWKVCGLYGSSTAPTDEPSEGPAPDDGPASNGEVPNPIPTG